MQTFPILRDIYGGYIAAQILKNNDQSLNYWFYQATNPITIALFKESPMDFLGKFGIEPNEFRRSRIPKAAYFSCIKPLEKQGFKVETTYISKVQIRGIARGVDSTFHFYADKDSAGKWSLIEVSNYLYEATYKPQSVEQKAEVLKKRLEAPTAAEVKMQPREQKPKPPVRPRKYFPKKKK